MFSNLGLKLRVFFLMAVVISALSAVNFFLFKSFLDKIDIQQGPKNSVKLIQEKVKNTTYNLIANSFNIAKQLKFEKASKNSPLRVGEITSETEYIIVDSEGEFVSGNIKLMSSQKGIPAVERALKEGLASDGSIVVGDSMYLIGAVPAMKDVPGKGKGVFGVISVKKLTQAFSKDDFPMPVRIFRGEKFIIETMSDKWSNVERCFGSDEMKGMIDELTKSAGSKKITGWTFLNSFFMPFDMLGGEKVTIITLVSTMPGWEDYRKVVLYSVLYTIIGIIVTLFFTFIVTHTIDKVFRNLATDISVMKVGEKLVMKKYSHGADIAVSALNTLISKYIKQTEDSMGSNSGPIGRQKKDNLVSGGGSLELDVPDPFGVDDIEDTPKKPVAVPQSKKQSAPKPVSEVAAPPPLSTTDDDEKTQIVQTDPAENLQPVAPEPQEADPMELLWNDYKRIKEKNGDSVTENEKRSFMGKVRTNRASIMAKYKCSDVSFSIEEKDGKPVIKAKPLNG